MQSIFFSQFESRLGEMRKSLLEKEAEIEELTFRLHRAMDEARVAKTSSSTPAHQQDISLLSQALKEREEQIEELQDNLAEAAK